MHQLVEKFCTPPFEEITNFDLRSAASAKRFCLDFEGAQLPVYSWGEGKKVLLIHGWGSRASHLSLLAKMIADSGFNVYAFDAPAHSSERAPAKTASSMFEFGRALSAVANYLGDVHAVAGHSLGSIASIFTLTGYGKYAGYKFSAEKLALISSPFSMEALLYGYAREQNLSEAEMLVLWKELEKEFDFKVEDYTAGKALKNNAHPDIMIAHDENDEDMSIENAYKINESLPTPARTFFTKGLGHRKILLNRDVMRAVSSFISGEE
jgi:esterase/lipase